MSYKIIIEIDDNGSGLLTKNYKDSDGNRHCSYSTFNNFDIKETSVREVIRNHQGKIIEFLKPSRSTTTITLEEYRRIH